MSGSHTPGYAAKVMFSNITDTDAVLSTSDTGFIDYLKANGDCYVCFVTPVIDTRGADKPESEPRG